MKHERKLTCGLAVWFLAQWLGIANRAVGQERELLAVAVAAHSATGDKLPPLSIAASFIRKTSAPLENQAPDVATLKLETVMESVSAPEDRESVEAPRSSPRRSRRAPWVHIRRLDNHAAGVWQGARPIGGLVFPPWSLVHRRSLFEMSEDPSQARLSLSYIPPRRETLFARGLKRIIQKKLGREARRRMKKTWREHYESTPTMSLAKYWRGLENINYVGRQQEQSLSVDEFNNRWKDDLFQRQDREGEQDVEILDWGPFVLMDSGSVRFDIGRVVHFGNDDNSGNGAKHESDEVKSVLATKQYRINTSVKLGFDPKAAYQRADPTWIVDHYGLSVGVAWLSDVLGREFVNAELEMEVDRNGEFAAFVNFVFKSRH